MKLLSVDIETGGLDIDCSLLEIALVLGEMKNNQLCISEIFHSIIKPNKLVIEKDAFEMHSKNGLLEQVFNPSLSVSLEVCAKELKTWLHNMFGGKQVNVIGSNFAGFDGPRIIQHLKVKPFWNYRVIDAKQLWMYPIDDGIPSMEVCAKRAYVTLGEVEHRAVQDAILALKLYESWWFTE